MRRNEFKKHKKQYTNHNILSHFFIKSGIKQLLYTRSIIIISSNTFKNSTDFIENKKKTYRLSFFIH